MKKNRAIISTIIFLIALIFIGVSEYYKIRIPSIVYIALLLAVFISTSLTGYQQGTGTAMSISEIETGIVFTLEIVSTYKDGLDKIYIYFLSNDNGKYIVQSEVPYRDGRYIKEKKTKQLTALDPKKT